MKDIKDSELILSENEINLKIDKYNKNLNDYTILIENFNLHYQKQIVNIRETILKEILILLEKYAIDNNTDLILDSTSYLIASNSLDITNIIENELSIKKLKLEYTNFEKIKFIDLKNIFEKNSINVSSELSDKEIFYNIKSISNAEKNDLSFYLM